jgi:hypothetical protein
MRCKQKEGERALSFCSAEIKNCELSLVCIIFGERERTEPKEVPDFA